MHKAKQNRLRALAINATPGRWRAANGKGSAMVVTDDPEHDCAIYLNVRTCEVEDTVKRWQADAKFIAAVGPREIIALLDYVEQLEKARDQACDIAVYEAGGTRDSTRAHLARIAELREIGL